MPARRRDGLVVLMAFAAGSLDAIVFIAMGGVFASVMTGNLVLLGVSVGRRDGALAAHGGVAIAGFVVGALIGAAVAGRTRDPRPVWPARVSAALVIELVLMAGLTVGWELAGGRPIGDAQLALLGTAAAAMGIQSSAVRGLGAPGLSTTYMTGTLTGVVGALVTGERPGRQGRDLALLVAAVVVGAGVGGLLVVESPRAAPAVTLAVLGLVVAAASTTARRAEPD